MPSPVQRFAHFLAVATAAATLFLVCVGAIVTSKGVGMAVPDWPTSYGYHMFLLPWDKWKEGGAFWEHSHRLFASGVGFMTMVLAIALWFVRPSTLLWKLGIAAFFAVVLQGILGGFRVVFAPHRWGVEFGILHAGLAQLFFSLLCVIALLTSRRWETWTSAASRPADGGSLRRWVPALTVLIFAQLIIGAAMRHQHAGLAIPDFPAAYGRFWPDISPEAVAGYNRARVSIFNYDDITVGQIVLQMVHRFTAYAITALMLLCWWKTRKSQPAGSTLRRFANFWLGLIVVQVALGAATIWTGKAFEIATAHVAIGALSLMTGVLFSVAAFRLLPVSPSVKVARSTAGMAGRTV